MDKLQIKLISDNTIVPKEVQRDLVCSNEESFPCPSLSLNSILSKDTLNSLEELGDVLKSIHRRMISEGYEIVDGVIRKV